MKKSKSILASVMVGLCPRVALHAATPGFIHLKTNKELFFEMHLPKDSRLLIEK